MKNEELTEIVKRFRIEGTVAAVLPLGDGLINDTYWVKTKEADKSDYVLQRINHRIFKDIDLLQHNIEIVTGHLRRKILSEGASDVDRRVLRFIPTFTGKTYHFDGQNYWRVSVYIADTVTVNEVTPQSSYDCGRAFGHFQKQLMKMAFLKKKF